MKKLTCVLLALCLLWALCLSASAAQYADVFELMTDWEMNGYPPDVAGICSTDGSADHITILLVGDDDGSRAAEISAMLEDPSTITFGVGSYTEAALQAIDAEICEEFINNNPDSGIFACGVGWGQNGGFGPGGNELRVVVDADPDRVEEYAGLFRERYGDAVVVEASERPQLESELDTELATELPEAAPENDIYGDLAEEPVAAPAPAEKEASGEPASDTGALPETGEAPSEMSTGVWIIVFAAAVALACVLVWLLRKRAKKK